MADNSKRTVAEKLAAAKKKHKAYLKEKTLKNNVTKRKDQEIENERIQPDTIPIESDRIESNNIDNIDTNHLSENENEKTQVDFSQNNAYEADLPLPQYPMDNYQATSLPDPLSFFDNFNYSNVGTTFQNITQPLTSFFNNSNNNPSDEDIVTPNQILIEEPNLNISNECNLQSSQNLMNEDTIGQQLFSYDRFKVNAINNPFTANEPQIDSNSETKEFIENPVFDQFTNAIESSTDFQNSGTASQNFENFAFPPATIQSNLQEFIPNAQELVIPENINDNISVTFEVKPEHKTVAINENENYNSNFEVKDEISKESLNPHSNSLSIQDISNDMNVYIKQARQFVDFSNISSNERPKEGTEELQLLLDLQNAKCLELSQKLFESETKYSKLETDYRNLEMRKQEIESDLKSQGDSHMANDLSKLREDLQCHLQTIGMLVAEKTELTTLLQETQTAFRNESSQCVDLQNEVKEMRIYYSDLEHELQSLKSEKISQNSSQKEKADICEKLQKELDETKAQCEVYMQDLLESREKLKGVTESNLELQRQIQEMGGQLSMANIKIQQLTLQESSELESQLRKLIEEKSSYEKQISMLNDALKTVSKEREESNIQYQQYAQQLNDQISTMVQRLDEQQKNNDQLKLQEENRIKHIGDLEKQLQNVQSDNTSYNLQRNNSFLKKELENSVEVNKNLAEEKEQLNNNLMKALVDKEVLEKELVDCKFSISQLESTVEQLRGSQPDNAVLLATMESDKVAASRAISQNNELKKQMEGMQEVMLKVNNDNVQLTETVSLERKTNKELLEKLQKTEISFRTLAEAIEIKDKELVHLRNQIENMTKQIIHQEQLSDRLHHYEAQNHSSSSLQLELQEAKQMIAHLTNELNIMKRSQLNQTSQMNQTMSIDQTDQMNQTNQIDQINQKTQTNGNFRKTKAQNGELTNSDVTEELRMQLSNLQIRNKELEQLLQNFHSTEEKKSFDTNGNEHLDKETAMTHLEKKFLRTMEEIARLTEEKQRLEHLVLQLQGETETIGEYVTLYQQQRSILKQRALEKDQQLQQLTNDRETIKANLDRLNSLVKKLISEKGAIPKELLDQHEHFSKDKNDLCTEHQKIHHEINKIASNGIGNSEIIINPNTEIAEEIISLLSEIKSSNLVQPNDEGIHHCPWCSGKLITV